MERTARTLPERLAGLLSQASGILRTEIRERRERLELRKAELAALLVQPPDLAALRRQAEELAAAVATRRQELAELERTRAEFERSEKEFEDRLDTAYDSLRAQCVTLATKLPLLDSSGAAGWVSWLDDWHLHHRRPFEPMADWRAHLSTLSTLNDAFKHIELSIKKIHELEVEEGELGLARSALPGEIAREEERIQVLETAVGERLKAIGARYGRIVDDLPEPAPNDTRVRLEQIEGLLANLDTTLGRFAASALLEAQMLEALE